MKQSSHRRREECFLRKLPQELLDEIFILTLPVIPSFQVTQSPLILTHVCGWWRDSAVSQSALWSTIYLPSPIEGLSCGIVELCKLWLSRSRNRNLSVDFHLASDYQPWKVTEEHVDLVKQIVQVLIPHAPRITKLLRILPRFLLDDLRLADMKNLDDLFICDVSDDKTGKTSVERRALKVPKTLRCLSLRQTFFDLGAFSSLSRLAHLDLWQLQGDGQMSLGTCLNVLRDLHWLESCTLDVALGDYSQRSAWPEITMPNLSFFFISWDWLVNVGPILGVLNAPNLRRLGLRGPPPTRRHWSHLKRFLARCQPKLTQLSIKEIGFTEIHLLECLHMLPTLVNLSISHCSIDSRFINALKLSAGEQNIMPVLEFLSLEACDDFDIRDLIDMLNTRGRYSENASLTPLRGLRISFCRRIRSAHRIDIENSGVENVIIRTKSSRHRS